MHHSSNAPFPRRPRPATRPGVLARRAVGSLILVAGTWLMAAELAAQVAGGPPRATALSPAQPAPALR